MSLRLQAYRTILHKRAQAFKEMDARVAMLVPFMESDKWQVVSVDLPSKEDGLGNLLVFVHFKVKPGGDSYWYTWCHRILRAGNAMGVRIWAELKIEKQAFIKDWVISFLYDLDKAEDFEVRLLEAIQRFRDVLAASR